MPKRSLRIGVLAPPWNKVPPDNYGGTEVIVDLLCRGFQQRGHAVTLWASGDSTCPVPRRHVIEKAVMPPDKYQEHRHLAAFIKDAEAGAYDIVHSHLEAIMPWAERLPCPVVCTLHVEVTKERAAFLAANTRVHFVAVSASQAKTFPIPATVIHNGLDIAAYPFTARKQDYLLYLGALVPEKGLDIAVTASRRLRLPLRIAGYLPARSTRWFNELMAGDDDGNLIYMGQVSHAEKIKLFRDARAVLCPVRWQEPFGLVAVEAMACGTPVVAMSSGALPEVVQDGISGFIAANEETFIEKVRAVGEIDPRACRDHCEKEFGHERMVENYLNLFAQVIKDK